MTYTLIGPSFCVQVTPDDGLAPSLTPTGGRGANAAPPPRFPRGQNGGNGGGGNGDGGVGGNGGGMVGGGGGGKSGSDAETEGEEEQRGHRQMEVEERVYEKAAALLPGASGGRNRSSTTWEDVSAAPAIHLTSVRIGRSLLLGADKEKAPPQVLG